MDFQTGITMYAVNTKKQSINIITKKEAAVILNTDLYQ